MEITNITDSASQNLLQRALANETSEFSLITDLYTLVESKEYRRAMKTIRRRLKRYMKFQVKEYAKAVNKDEAKIELLTNIKVTDKLINFCTIEYENEKSRISEFHKYLRTGFNIFNIAGNGKRDEEDMYDFRYGKQEDE